MVVAEVLKYAYSDVQKVISIKSNLFLCIYVIIYYVCSCIFIVVFFFIILSILFQQLLHLVLSLHTEF